MIGWEPSTDGVLKKADPVLMLWVAPSIGGVFGWCSDRKLNPFCRSVVISCAQRSAYALE